MIFLAYPVRIRSEYIYLSRLHSPYWNVLYCGAYLSNRLINESSPYLLQHSNNPVDWYPWASEAFLHAKTLDKPVILSVGYFSCHWCHVMERESFENPQIAALMNQNFISIKVDREERPDIDSIYMKCVQAFSGHGGWPLTVFLTPDAEPFYGGTYFPPTDRGNIPSFPRVLQAISHAYQNDKKGVLDTKSNILDSLVHFPFSVDSDEQFSTADIDMAFQNLIPEFDVKHGGTGIQPKFPQPMIWEFLLKVYDKTSSKLALDAVTTTLDNMAYGGIYDQLGGGFHRYSTDMYWIVPHFEKMLYDNAQLVRLYLHAWQITKKPLYRRIVHETLDYIVREMTDPSGGFYSSQDADSEGVEGKYFVWTKHEIATLLEDSSKNQICDYFGITAHGNFEGKNILHVPSFKEFDQNESFNDACKSLLEIRNDRINPELDNKILTSWNAMTLQAFAEAGSAFERDDYIEVARNNAKFLLTNLSNQEGRLLRTWKNGNAKLNAYLEDYAYLGLSLLSLHESTMDPDWLESSIRLAYEMVDLFWDEGQRTFFDTGFDHEKLILRPREYTDNALPCGNSLAVDLLLRLSLVTNNNEFHRIASLSLYSMKSLMSKVPLGAGNWLCNLDFYLSSPFEIVLVGDPGSSELKNLAGQIFTNFISNRILVSQPDENSKISRFPIFDGRTLMDGEPVAYVCQNYTCNFPTKDPDELLSQLIDKNI